MDKIHQLHRELKHKHFKWGYSKYYDHPDGQDLLGKLSFTTKMAILPSSFIAYCHGHNVSPRAITKKEKLFRMFKFMVPAIGMAVVFTCVTYFSTNIRKKDDPFNHFLGGLAAGSIVGFVSGNAGSGVIGAGIFGFLATILKAEQLDERGMFPPVKTKNFSSYYYRNWNFSLMPDNIRGNWTRDPPSVEN